MCLYRSVIILFSLLILVSCESDEVGGPRATFNVYYGNTEEALSDNPLITTTNDQGTNVLTVFADSAIVFVNTGMGTHFSIWPGQGNNNYFKDEEDNRGIDFPLDEKVGYTYQNVGVDTLIMWATTLKSDGSAWSRDSAYYLVEVIEKPE